jgi:pimeloyl-ACP methyl ester carboxylesterase
MAQTFHRRALLRLAAAAAFLTTGVTEAASDSLGVPPAGFSSAQARVNGTSLHYVRGGRGPAVILIHGFPEDWVEYRAVMPRLAQRFTVVAVDLPGIGRSAPASGGYDAANLAANIHGLVQSLNLDHPYVVGHDLGGLVTYAYVRRFPDSLRGAMILDVPIPGLAGWDEATAGFWHIGFIQAPGELAEKLVVGRQAIFLGWSYDFGKFTPEERAYYVQSYGPDQLHAAFEIYRAFPEDAKWNEAQNASNSVPLVVVVGEKSFFAPLLTKFVDGYRAKGMVHVEGALIPGAAHYLLADSPEAVDDLIEQHAGGDSK